jgi:hypothetical protein
MKQLALSLLWLFGFNLVAFSQELAQESQDQEIAEAAVIQPGPWKRVHLNWKPSQTPGVYYRIYRAWAPLKIYVLIGQTRLTQFTDWPWPGHYLYRVTAFNPRGESNPTNTIEVIAPPAYSH